MTISLFSIGGKNLIKYWDRLKQKCFSLISLERVWQQHCVGNAQPPCFFKLSSCNVIQDLTVLASQMHPNALIDSLQYKVNPIKLISPEQLSSKILSYTMVL